MNIERRHLWWAAIAVACARGSWPTLKAWTAPDLAIADQGCPLSERALDDQYPLQTQPDPLPGPWVIDGRHYSARGVQPGGTGSVHRGISNRQ